MKEKILNKIKEYITKELKKRGIFVKVENIQKIYSPWGERYWYSTSNFNTTPVLFEDIRIIGYIHYEDGNIELKAIAQYQLFEGGMNVCTLFKKSLKRDML